MKTKKRYYVRVWTMGRAVHANTGKPVCEIIRFDSPVGADKFAEDWEPPNNCPSAYAERVKRREIAELLPRQNKWGDWSDNWLASPDGRHEKVMV